jgi:hypothetical protein
MHRQSATPPTTDPVAATAVVLADDGFSLGVLYRGDCPPAADADADADGHALRD